MGKPILREETRKLVDILHLAVITLDGELQVTYWNKTAENIFGWREGEALNKYLHELLFESKEGIRQTLKGEKQLRRFIRKNGSAVLCECSGISFEGGYVLVCRDVTMELEREKELESYKHFFESSQDMFFRVGRVDVNPKLANALGYSKDELVGAALNPLVHPEDLERVKKEFLRVLKGETRKYEVRMVSKKGDTVWVEVTAWPWRRDGVTVGSEGILRDVTERKMEEERVKILSERLEILNSILRHDLTNYLSVISNYIELFEEKPDKNHLEKIRNLIGRSLELVKDVRTVEEAEKKGRVLKVVNLSKMLLNEVEGMRAPDVKIEAKVPENIYVWANEVLNSVFANILQNAVLHNDKEVKEVNVTIKADEGWVEVRIADNGPGIPDNMKEEVFKEGVRGPTGRTGLGLYLVKTLVERYGGEVWVEDNLPSGSIFVVRLREAGLLGEE